MSTSDHVDVGAYVLGVLDPPDEEAFARHFAACASCRAQYRELADLPRLLDQLKTDLPAQRRAAEPALDDRVLDAALAEIGSTRRGRRRTLWLAAAAAGVLLVAVPIAVWGAASGDGGAPVAGPTVTVSAPSPQDSGKVAGARTLTSTDPATGATVILTVDGDSGSTSVELAMFAVPGPAEGTLRAVTRTGYREDVLHWDVVVGAPRSQSSGTVDIPMSELVGFEVRQDDNGPVKLDIST